MAVIGFIGIGRMGGPMVRNVLAAGHDVTAYDLSADALSFAVQAGARAASSAAGAARGAEVCLTMLPTGAEVGQALLDDGAMAAAAAGTLFIDSSTIDVETAQALHAGATKAGLAMLDAPVSGGTVGAESSTLTFMCGGEAAVFARARPILEAMGETLVHCGGPGMGQAAKLCNNMVAAIGTLAISESFVMGQRLGLDVQTLYDVMSSSTATSWVLEHMCPVPGPVPTSPANREFAPGFAASLMLKDLKLSQAAARSVEAPSPLGALTHALYAAYVNAGNGHLDTSSIIRLLEGKAD
ncbi:MAG: 3-hydroxyisobutyrate dehydrogenase [Alphaproteobacteria bacterium]|jgi:3-hydroxyisobutyrate dehydrogenase|nr:3-hydroxyisobutyrate dehydrogenase [Alphaproteobacteria bacterium]MDP6239025.1 3-hydroxyisobutyrate dehydrogenase [Alphaproteobacteria bacterium]MDP7173281.1 3-hydroxyisobutyrate dehydrogenase [Alphaproteobacteria bacterium]MDP7234110.1 3-hydroxyisobutyrate dehydrogenase [Alphaproteobacteria bacterium]MDP7487020.1 3-hydroxyisobutyrate dehydrogenase [Alphaproteobacteria bacterium]